MSLIWLVGMLYTDCFAWNILLIFAEDRRNSGKITIIVLPICRCFVSKFKSLVKSMEAVFLNTILQFVISGTVTNNKIISILQRNGAKLFVVGTSASMVRQFFHRGDLFKLGITL